MSLLYVRKHSPSEFAVDGFDANAVGWVLTLNARVLSQEERRVAVWSLDRTLVRLRSRQKQGTSDTPLDAAAVDQALGEGHGSIRQACGSHGRTAPGAFRLQRPPQVPRCLAAPDGAELPLLLSYSELSSE